MNRLAVVALLLTFTTIPTLVSAEGRSHVAILGALVLIPEGPNSTTDPSPYGRSGALQISAGWLVSPRVAIDVEFARTRENEASAAFGRAVASFSVRNRYRDLMLIPLLRLRMWQRGKGALDGVAGIGWLREQFETEHRSSGFMPPGPPTELVTLSRERRNTLVFTTGVDVTGWMTPAIGLSASGRIRVANRNDAQASRPSPLAFSSGLGLRVRF